MSPSRWRPARVCCTRHEPFIELLRLRHSTLEYLHGTSLWELHERAFAGELAPAKPYNPRTLLRTMIPPRLNVAGWPRLAGRERWREPTLKELLAEPIIRTLMDADGVDSAELKAMLRQASEALRTTH
jgi:hypothetical protein